MKLSFVCCDMPLNYANGATSRRYLSLCHKITADTLARADFLTNDAFTFAQMDDGRNPSRLVEDGNAVRAASAHTTVTTIAAGIEQTCLDKFNECLDAAPLGTVPSDAVRTGTSDFFDFLRNDLKVCFGLFLSPLREFR